MVQQLLQNNALNKITGKQGRGIVITGDSGTGKTLMSVMLRDALIDREMSYRGSLNFKDDVGVLRIINDLSEKMVNPKESLDNCFIVLDDIPVSALNLVMDMLLVPLMKSNNLTVVIVASRPDQIKALNAKYLFPVWVTTYKVDNQYTATLEYTDLISQTVNATLC